MIQTKKTFSRWLFLAMLFGLKTASFAQSFSQKLFIPDTLSTANLDTIKLVIKNTQKVFFSGVTQSVIPGFPLRASDTLPVNTLSYTNTTTNNPGILGPTIIWWYGDSVTMSVENTLDDTTTTHWHGAHVAPMNDGGPHQPIAPHSFWNRSFKIRDDVSTMWYHPHLHMKTMEQVNKGMAGMIITKNASDLKALKLPHTYGVDDYPIILQDKFFIQDTLRGQNFLDTGCSMGTTFLVNGTWQPYQNMPAQKNRMRILNGSSERAYCLFLRDSTAQAWVPFHVIASDAGYLEKPHLMGMIPTKPSIDSMLIIMPGERYELVVDATGLQNHDLYLMNMRNLFDVSQPMLASFAGGPSLFTPSCYGDTINQPYDSLGNGGPGMLPNLYFDSYPIELLKINITAPNGKPGNLPQSLQSYYIPDTTGARIRNKGLYFYNADSMAPPFSIDSTNFDEMVINDTVYLDDIEMWKVSNKSLAAHPLHIHDIHFFIRSIKDQNGNELGVPPYMRGPKDVAAIPNTAKFSLVMKFTDFATPLLPENGYMYHCHILAHEDGGMMHQFVVTNRQGNGISQVNAALNWKLYPNPTTGDLWIETENKGGTLKMYNMVGTLVKEWNMNKLGNKSQLDIAELSGGMYILKLDQPEGVSTQRISIVR